jgi:hypothetical protein
MPRGDKSKYTGKQERKADHIAESYESRGVPAMEAERRAWATVTSCSVLWIATECALLAGFIPTYSQGVHGRTAGAHPGQGYN